MIGPKNKAQSTKHQEQSTKNKAQRTKHKEQSTKNKAQRTSAAKTPGGEQSRAGRRYENGWW
jgi:hypothetical protein